MTMEPGSAPEATPSRSGKSRILVLNHRADPFEDLITGLRRDGLEVAESRSLKTTRDLLDSGAIVSARPTVVLLNPLVLQSDGIEIELLANLHRDNDPVPVILLVEDLPALTEARRLSMQFADFVVKPASTPELMHRIELAVRTRDRFVSLHQRALDLANQVTIDFKTGLLSERHFKSILQVEFKRAQRHHLPLSLLLVDVDNFKGVNDTTDYDFGDKVLCQVATELKDNVRETDYAARYGGDEFVLLLPHTTPAEAVHTAMRIRKAIGAAVVESERYKHRVTVSIGIDTFDGRSTTTADALRRRANKALQEAKRRGKDQVWLYSERAEGGAQSVGS
jgi:diguanylate cyclase (GGDEF)-like protein